MSVPATTYGQPAQLYPNRLEDNASDQEASPLRGRVKRAADTTIRATSMLATIAAIIAAIFALLCKIFVG